VSRRDVAWWVAWVAALFILGAIVDYLDALNEPTLFSAKLWAGWQLQFPPGAALIPPPPHVARRLVKYGRSRAQDRR
jgi:hypothetical protein